MPERQLWFGDSEDNHIESAESSQFAQNDWVDIGIVDVDLAKIDLSDSPVHGPDDFHKVSYEEMKDGFEKLQNDVLPAVEQGANGDDFWQMDQERSSEYREGFQRVYDAFYGDSSIRLTKVDDHYEVVNGYHRLYVAKEMGLSSVPARVIQNRFQG